jgi:hypothetical protein
VQQYKQRQKDINKAQAEYLILLYCLFGLSKSARILFPENAGALLD